MNGVFCKKGVDVTAYPSIPLEKYRELPVEEMRERIDEFYKDMDRRRTVREFADKPVPRDIIETALKAANTAPSQIIPYAIPPAVPCQSSRCPPTKGPTGDQYRVSERSMNVLFLSQHDISWPIVRRRSPNGTAIA